MPQNAAESEAESVKGILVTSRSEDNDGCRAKLGSVDTDVEVLFEAITGDKGAVNTSGSDCVLSEA